MQTLNRNNYGATLAEAEQHLRNHETFHTGTLSGEWAKDWDGKFGYIVKSYGVVIARNVDDNWDTGVVFENAYNYSVTTSKHANLVKKAWGL